MATIFGAAPAHARYLATVLSLALAVQACGRQSKSEESPPPAEKTPTAGEQPDANNGGTAGGPSDGGTTPRPGTPTADGRVEAALILSLVTPDTPAAPSDAVALQVLAARCQTCHNPAAAPRWDLTTLPAEADQWSELKRRIELPLGTPGHMPIGGDLTASEKADLSGWLDSRLNPPVSGDAFAGYAVVAREVGRDAATFPVEAQPDGRYTIRFGARARGDKLNLELAITGTDGITRPFALAALEIPAGGIVYQTLTVAGRDVAAPRLDNAALRATDVGDAHVRLVWNAANDDRPRADLSYELYQSDVGNLSRPQDIARRGRRLDSVLINPDRDGETLTATIEQLNADQTYYFYVVVRDRTGNLTAYRPLQVRTTGGPVEARLDLRLVATGSTPVSDEAAQAIFTNHCAICHTADSGLADLSVLPGADLWSDIARRINLPEDDPDHMPIGNTLPADEQTTLNRWLTEQQNPPGADPFAGYALRATDESGHALTASDLVDGRARFALGRQRVGDTVRVTLIVTGADGVEQRYPLTLTVPANGATSHEISVMPRDTVAPTIEDRELRVHELGANSFNLKFKAASDNRSAELLAYEVYRSARAELDSLDQIDANGSRVGDTLSGRGDDGLLGLEIAGLEPATVYYFNVVVRDRTGNRTAYRKLRVLTMPAALCDDVTTAGGLQAWRDQLAQTLSSDSNDDASADVVRRVNRCFPNAVPQCVQRTLDYAQREDIAPTGSDGGIDDVPQKRPPREFIDPATGKYWMPDNIEEIARQKGWTTARYKSRHAGGFDSDTPNLLMVFVPGDRVDPPVEFDRWINLPLPRDDDEPAAGTPQHPRPKFAPPTREEYAEHSDELPSTFTMVSQDRARDGRPATVYFQMFGRGSSYTFSPRGPVSVGSCVSCHPNGLRAISPLGYHLRAGEEALPDDNWKAVELINRKMEEGAGYKAAQWGTGRVGDTRKPLYRSERGPIIGAARPVNGISRTREFIMGGTINGQHVDGCFKRSQTISVTDIFGRRPGIYAPTSRFRLSSTASPNIDPDKVARAMNCEGCHTNGQRWSLNEDTDFSQVQFKILVDQSMPLGMHANPLDPGNTGGQVVDELTGDERIALANCLEAEFDLERRNVGKWMTQESCSQ